MAATSRDDLLRLADGFVRQGRLDAAIESYEQLVQLPPADWNLIKQLADLQERAGHREAAAVRFVQCADHYFEEGFLARAAALYRKVLKLDTKSEHALSKLADVSLDLKLTVDARQALSQLVTLRRARGDDAGALAAVARLSALEGVTVRMPAPEVPASRPESDATPVITPVPIPDPEPEPLPEPPPALVAPDPEPELEHAPRPDSEPEPEHEPEPDPEPELEPERNPERDPQSEPEPVPEPGPRPVFGPEPEPVVDADAVRSFVSAQESLVPAQELGEEPPAASAHGFDWGALLGRDIEPLAGAPAAAPGAVDAPAAVPPAADPPVPDPPAPDPIVVPPAMRPEPLGSSVGPMGSDAAEVGQPVEVEETDLTELLDQLAAERLPSFPAEAPAQRDAPAPEASSPTLEDMVAPVASVEAMVEGDARTVAAQQLAAGRVFAAAGLVAEAARSFERASRDVRTRFEAAEALGSLHRSRGQLTEAVRWYDEAAQAPVADETVRRPVLYDLAEALEAVGQPGRALAVLLDLLSEVEDYRDARARADRLFRVDAGG